MSKVRTTPTTMAVVLFGLALPSAALAQVCIGLPARDGEISLQGGLMGHTQESGVGYAGRLGINFNTPVTLDVGIERPRFENDGLGTTVSGTLAFEVYDYEPSICPYGGIRYETVPTPAGDLNTTTIPVGLGFGKRLGSARGLSLAIYALPEYVFQVEPDDAVADEAFLDQFGDRSEGRGTLGLLIATPLIYATGSVRVTTVDASDPTLSLGVGMTF